MVDRVGYLFLNDKVGLLLFALGDALPESTLYKTVPRDACGERSRCPPSTTDSGI